MTRDDVSAYARKRADDWNRLDLDAVLEHFEDDINGRHDRAAEILHFGRSGRVDRGEVLYGVIAQETP